MAQPLFFATTRCMRGGPPPFARYPRPPYPRGVGIRRKRPTHSCEPTRHGEYRRKNGRRARGRVVGPTHVANCPRADPKTSSGCSCDSDRQGSSGHRFRPAPSARGGRPRSMARAWFHGHRPASPCRTAPRAGPARAGVGTPRCTGSLSRGSPSSTRCLIRTRHPPCFLGVAWVVPTTRTDVAVRLIYQTGY